MLADHYAPPPDRHCRFDLSRGQPDPGSDTALEFASAESAIQHVASTGIDAGSDLAGLPPGGSPCAADIAVVDRHGCLGHRDARGASSSSLAAGTAAATDRRFRVAPPLPPIVMALLPRVGNRVGKYSRMALNHGRATCGPRLGRRFHESRRKPPAYSIREEVEEVAERRCVAFVELGVPTPSARDRREFLVLNIEQFGERPTGRLEHIGLELFIATFRALPVFVLHRFTPLPIYCSVVREKHHLISSCHATT